MSSENRRERDRAATPAKGPIDRLGDALKPDGTQVEIPDVRSSDLEPYVGLRYLSKLFKLMGVILGLLLLAEIITGFVAMGRRRPRHPPHRRRSRRACGAHPARAADTRGHGRRATQWKHGSIRPGAGHAPANRRAGMIVAMPEAAMQHPHFNEGWHMLWTIAVILLILWLLGFFAFHVGSIIHILLVIAVIVIIYRLITGRRPVV
jgi:hypothetical protein